MTSLFGQGLTRVECYVSRGVLTLRLTSELEARKNRAAMNTAIRKLLDTCTASGCLSPSWSHSLLGEFLPRVNTIEF
jgi:methylase of polypeptide subunit release factors